MTKNREKEGSPLILDRDSYLISLVNSESSVLNESLEIIEQIAKKHKLDIKQVIDLMENKDKYIYLPIGIFRSKLGPLEAVVRYMKDILKYNFSQIAKLLSRDETTIWTSYNNSLEKGKIILDVEMAYPHIKKSDLIVPLSIFSERSISILEALCLYLKQNFNLNYREIGLLLERNERTIWTVISRASKKLK